MLSLALLILSGPGLPGVRAPTPPQGIGIAYRESQGPNRRRSPVKTSVDRDYYPAVLRWTHVQRRCERSVDNCIIGPPDLLARELPPTNGQRR